MKIKDVYFALNEIEQRIVQMYLSENCEEESLSYLLDLKFRLLNCDINDVEGIESKVVVIYGYGQKNVDFMKRFD